MLHPRSRSTLARFTVNSSIRALTEAPAAGRASHQRTGRADSATTQALPLSDSAIYHAYQYRLIGPFRGGRANAVTGVPSQPFVYYAGYTGGGVWKTENAGASWKNVSDSYFNVGSVGAIAVA